MAKDPALLWYPSDWISGTHGMTLEEKGAYMELLMLQFNRGHMTSHMIGQTVGQVFGQIKDKFKMDEKKRWYNERLDIEKDKRKKYVQSRRNNVSGKNQHSKKIVKNEDLKGGHMTSHKTSHMEDIYIYNKESLKNNTIIEDNSIDSNNLKSETCFFDTMPKVSDFNGLPEIKIGASIQLIKFTQHTDITEEQVKNVWEVFKIQNLTGKKYYQNEDEVYSHFINWIKTQKFEDEKSNNKNSKKLGTSEARIAALRNW